MKLSKFDVFILDIYAYWSCVLIPHVRRTIHALKTSGNIQIYLSTVRNTIQTCVLHGSVYRVQFVQHEHLLIILCCVLCCAYVFNECTIRETESFFIYKMNENNMQRGLSFLYMYHVPGVLQIHIWGPNFPRRGRYYLI